MALAYVFCCVVVVYTVRREVPVTVTWLQYMYNVVRPISLLTSSLLTLPHPNFPGNPLWTWEFHPFKLRLCSSPTLENPMLVGGLGVTGRLELERCLSEVVYIYIYIYIYMYIEMSGLYWVWHSQWWRGRGWGREERELPFSPCYPLSLCICRCDLEPRSNRRLPIHVPIDSGPFCVDHN